MKMFVLVSAPWGPMSGSCLCLVQGTEDAGKLTT